MLHSFVGTRSQSEAIYAKARMLIPAGVNSPARAFNGLDISPLIPREGQGALLWDVDGNRFIDCCCGWGALILGHAHERVRERIDAEARKGWLFGATAPCEVQLAEKIRSHFPHCEKLRFVVTGTEATMSAVRLARKVTGRSRIVTFEGHYHGHSDALLTATALPFNDIEACRAFFRTAKDLAAVIVEPVAANMGVVPAEPGFLAMLREETTKAGALLIFDEVVTGYRMGLGSAVEIAPDLTCLGKIIGGGFPVAAFGGRQELMDQLAPLGSVYQAGTYAGHSLSMHAAFETLTILEEPGIYQSLLQKTEELAASLREAIARKNLRIAVNAKGAMFSLFFGVSSVRSWEDVKRADKRQFKAFFRHLFDRGIFLCPSQTEAHFISAAHTKEHIDEVRDAILDFFNHRDHREKEK